MGRIQSAYPVDSSKRTSGGHNRVIFSVTISNSDTRSHVDFLCRSVYENADTITYASSTVVMDVE